jgi:ABC-type oligopeptide transport system substrate-binding subunit
LEIAELPTHIRGLIMARSDGNPLYLEEIIRNFIDQGVIVREDHRWRAREEITEIPIPETLHGVLLARIDRLEEDVRSTLQLASVIGRSFMYRLLEAIAEAEKHLDTHLTLLQRADLVREKARWPELEYIFKHSLTQEAAYDSLLIERRKAFHLRVGEAIEELFTDRREEFYGLLAHHFEAAGAKEKALDYLIKTGDKSSLEDAHKEAITFYERALGILADSEEDPRIAKIWLKLGLIHQTSFDYDEAHKAYDIAFTIEQKNKPQHKSKGKPDVVGQAHAFRIGLPHAISTLDPGTIYWTHEDIIVHQLFDGLAELNSEANVLPLMARSWEVLDGGKRYVFHLREDVAWTDGTPVTAMDFEWAWKRNLHPDLKSSAARVIDDVVGARDYRLGVNPDPDSVGVRALDPITLEVRLNTPVAYFIYVITQSITFPLPRHLIERVGEEWWHPEHIQSNGPFQLAEFNENGGKIVKEHSYYGDFPGNLNAVEWLQDAERERTQKLYLEGKLEWVWSLTERDLVEGISPDEISYSSGGNQVAYFMLNPLQPPFDDLRVRKAFVHAFDVKTHMEVLVGPGTPYATGGMVPSRMAGHSPNIALGYDPSTARKYLHEAGIDIGQDFPRLDFVLLSDSKWFRRIAKNVADQINQVLGFQFKFHSPKSHEGNEDYKRHIYVFSWVADYPDPDNILRQALTLTGTYKLGWQNATYDQVIKSAARTEDRVKRLAMYRQADRILVCEDVVILPIHYGEKIGGEVLKPYVRGLDLSALGQPRMRYVTLDR